MNIKSTFNKVVKLISIPLLIIALSAYVPDVYPCTQPFRMDLYDVLVSAACVQMVAQIQMLLLVIATVFTIIIFAAEFYQFKLSLSPKDKELTK